MHGFELFVLPRMRFLMKIVAISDTHLKGDKFELPSRLLDELQSAEMVLHTGDFVEASVFERLAGFCELRAVHGNMDSAELKSSLPQTRVEVIEGVRIGLIHGFGGPRGLETRVKTRFKSASLDVLVFGHSHQAMNRRQEGLLLFNPGSPTDKSFALSQSFGILVVKDGDVKGEIVRCQ